MPSASLLAYGSANPGDSHPSGMRIGSVQPFSRLAVQLCFKLAEREGFEPPEPCGSPDFKSGAIDHSATSPSEHVEKLLGGLQAECPSLK